MNSDDSSQLYNDFEEYSEEYFEDDSENSMKFLYQILQQLQQLYKQQQNEDTQENKQHDISIYKQENEQIFERYNQCQSYQQKYKIIQEILQTKTKDQLLLIFYHLSNKDHLTSDELFKKLPRAVCGKVGIDSIGYKCNTCSTDINSIFCKECFDLEKHKGHDYQVTKFSGQCDCGDIAAIQHCWCDKHYGNIIQHDITFYENQGFDKEFCCIFISQVFQLFIQELVQQKPKPHILQKYKHLLENTAFRKEGIDFYRNCIVNTLFHTIEQQEQQFPDNFMHPQFEIQLIDNQIILNDIENRIINHNIPLIVYASHISQIKSNQSVSFLEQSIACTIISTPCYRQGLCHYMPQIYDTFYHQLIKLSNDEDNIYWIQVIVQLYSSIRLTEYQSLVQQWTQYYWCKKFSYQYLENKQDIVYYYQLPTDIIQILSSDYHSQYHNQYCTSLTQMFQQQYKWFYTHFYQCANSKLDQIVDYFNRQMYLQSDLYGCESLNHMANVALNQQSLLVTLLYNIEYSQLTIQFRNTVIEYDYNYNQEVQFQFQKLQTKLFYQLFIVSLVGYEYTKDVYYLRSHQNFTRKQIDQSITKDKIRENIALVTINLINMQSEKLQQYNQNCKNILEKIIIMHNIYVTLLAYMLISQDIVNNNSSQFLFNIIQQLEKQKQQAGINITSTIIINNIIYILCNILLSHALYQSNQFVYYPDVNFSRIYNEKNENNAFNQQNIYNIFYILKILYDNGYKQTITNQLLHMFEIKEIEYQEKQAKMYMQLIKYISILEYSNSLQLQDIEQLKINNILEVMLEYNNDKILNITETLKCFHWYQEATQKQLLENYIKKRQQQSYQKIYYDSNDYYMIYSINEDKYNQISWLNPQYCLKNNFSTSMQQINKNYINDSFKEIQSAIDPTIQNVLQNCINQISQNQQLLNQYDYILLSKLNSKNNLNIPNQIQEKIQQYTEQIIYKPKTGLLLKQNLMKLKMKAQMQNTDLEENVVQQQNILYKNNYKLHYCSICGFDDQQQFMFKFYSCNHIRIKNINTHYFSCGHYSDLQCYNRSISLCPMCKCRIQGIYPVRIDVGKLDYDILQQLKDKLHNIAIFHRTMGLTRNDLITQKIYSFIQLILQSFTYGEEISFIQNRIKDFLLFSAGEVIQSYIQFVETIDQISKYEINQFAQKVYNYQDTNENIKQIASFIVKIVDKIIIDSTNQQNNNQEYYINQQEQLDQILKQYSQEIIEKYQYQQIQMFDLRKIFSPTYVQFVYEQLNDKCQDQKCIGYRRLTQNFICLNCGQKFCIKCYLDHIQNGCSPACMLHIGRNILLIDLLYNYGQYYLEAAPYLDQNGQNDMQRLNRVELYRNDELVLKLQRLTVWKLIYFYNFDETLSQNMLQPYLEKFSREEKYL